MLTIRYVGFKTTTTTLLVFIIHWFDSYCIVCLEFCARYLSMIFAQLPQVDASTRESWWNVSLGASRAYHISKLKRTIDLFSRVVRFGILTFVCALMLHAWWGSAVQVPIGAVVRDVDDRDVHHVLGAYAAVGIHDSNLAQCVRLNKYARPEDFFVTMPLL